MSALPLLQWCSACQEATPTWVDEWAHAHCGKHDPDVKPDPDDWEAIVAMQRGVAR